MIEGHLAPGDRAVVVEDVLTSGGSVLEAIGHIEEAGAKVVRVIGIVDRRQGAREAIEGRGYRFTPIFTRDDLRIEELRAERQP